MTVRDSSGQGVVPNVGELPDGYTNKYADAVAQAINDNDPELLSALQQFVGEQQDTLVEIDEITDLPVIGNTFLKLTTKVQQRASLELGSAAQNNTADFIPAGGGINATQINAGIIDSARLPPSVASSLYTQLIPAGGTIASLTVGEQAQVVTTSSQTTVVLVTDGRRFIWKGAGSKTLEASYIQLADDTPDWDAIQGKPSTFTPATHATTHSAGGGDPLTLDNLAGTLGIAKGGTGQTTAQGARNALLPTQTGNALKVLGTDGSNTSWVAQTGSGGTATNGAGNSADQGGTVATTIRITETAIGTAITITPTSDIAQIEIEAFLAVTKDPNVTSRSYTGRIRHVNTSGTIVDADVRVIAGNAEKTFLHLAGFHIPGVATATTYIVTIVSATETTSSAGTVTAYGLTGHELAGAVGATSTDDWLLLTGSSRRTLRAELADRPLMLTNFGGVCNYTGSNSGSATDDTTALEKLIAELKKSTTIRRKAVIPAGTKLNPAAIDWTGVTDIDLEFQGPVYLTSRLILPANSRFIGNGRRHFNSPFLWGVYTVFQTNGFSGPAIQYRDEGTGHMEGIGVLAHTGGPSILVGWDAADVGARQSANLTMINCAASAGTGQDALRIENTFWARFFRCAFTSSSGGAWSINIADSYNPGGGNNNSGLLDFKNIIISARGVNFGTNGAPASTGHHFWFDEMHFENVLTAFVTFSQANKTTRDLVLRRSQLADVITATELPIIDNRIKSPLNGVTVQLNNQAKYRNPMFVGKPPTIFGGTGTFYSTLYDALYNVTGADVAGGFLSGLPVKRELDYDGEKEICPAFRGRDMSMQAMPANAVILTDTSDIATWTVASGTPTITAAQTAPDGSATAFRMQAVGSASVRRTISAAAVTAHWIFVGGWFRSVDQENRPQIGSAAPLLRMTMQGATTGYWDGDTSISVVDWDIIGIRANSKQMGWLFLGDARQYNSASGPTQARLQVVMANGSDFLVWKPFAFALPQTVCSARDAAALVSQLAVIDAAAKPGVIHTMAHQTTRTGLDSTANRPPAATVGPAAQFYDVTLGKPVWSNGTVWKDAAGTTV